jgi:hypothetical protein
MTLYSEVGNTRGGIPLIGGGIGSPFEGASAAGSALEAAGQSQQMAVNQSGAGIDLLALRALATQKISAISKVDPDAMAAWRSGDEGVMRALAQLELKGSGVRLRE